MTILKEGKTRIENFDNDENLLLYDTEVCKLADSQAPEMIARLAKAYLLPEQTQ